MAIRCRLWASTVVNTQQHIACVLRSGGWPLSWGAPPQEPQHGALGVFIEGRGAITSPSAPPRTALQQHRIPQAVNTQPPPSGIHSLLVTCVKGTFLYSSQLRPSGPQWGFSVIIGLRPILRVCGETLDSSGRLQGLRSVCAPPHR